MENTDREGRDCVADCHLWEADVERMVGYEMTVWPTNMQLVSSGQNFKKLFNSCLEKSWKYGRCTRQTHNTSAATIKWNIQLKTGVQVTQK